ncbi:O-antigen ligase family protein [Neorhizobium sp. P12A]|uniref:O-antigen ligase family protein n=1 Tax=Rhizobium/Agrobacterium group TaxID=227290 RepID=UPI00104CF46E|nr:MULTISPECIES: O-antigen ligase [Rhizobium/Agrobacterium group]KAA0691419.1 O-antigen ligase family protein [Neorhizobium sp. P12A]TCR73213.1 exopolysaccharide production protein ExoQ [Rhizobium sp. BK376]
MRIAKSIIVEPSQNLAYGVVALALSFFVFAYSSWFGQPSILLYYALWFPLILIDYRNVLGNYRKYGWIFAFGIFTCLTIFWSAAPPVTARAAIQYMTHIICALIAMRVLDIRSMTLGGVAGVGLVLIYSLLFGYYSYDALDGTFSFVGAFDSKNQLGLYASLGIFFCFAAIFILGERRMLWLGGCGIVGLMSAYCLMACQSATSVITTAAVLALLTGMRVILFLSPQQRKLLFTAGATALVILAVAGVYLGAVDAILGVFGKDSTLTGRTYLWQQGIEAASRSPFIGIGYQAFWVQGFSEPERLWEEFFITSRAGFHFHNTYIETTVETGLIGVTLLALVLIVALFGHLKRLLSDMRNNESYILFGISALLLVRSFVEIDILNPYHVGSFLLYFTAGKLTVARAKTNIPSITYYDQIEMARS